MSNVDNRIVEMQFDNKQFERGVKETMSTLDKLKQSLKLDNVEDGFNKLGKASDNAKKNVKELDGVSLGALASEISGIGKAVDALQKRFTAVGEAINDFKRKMLSTVKEMTVGQISTGFNKYATTTESVQTLMATLGKESKGQIYESINELNEYSDATSYDLASMTQNLSMFVNAGNGLDKSVKAIKGIGNAAALAGVSVQKTNNVMKNFSDALAMGKMQAIDWKSLEYLGFTAKPIREEFIKTAKAMGTLDKEGWVLDEKGKKKMQVTYQNFRDTLRYDWMTTDVMLETLKKYADVEDTENELAQEAFQAAKVARTYGEAMDAVKDAVSTGWMHVFEYIFGDVDEAAKLWTSLSDTLIDRLSSPFFTWMDNIFGTWKGLGGREKMIRIFSEIADMFIGLEEETVKEGVLVNGVLTEGEVTTTSLLSALLNSWRTVFGAIEGSDLLMFTERIRAAFVKLHEWMDTKNEKGVTVWEDLLHILQGVFTVLKTVYGFGKSVVSGIWKGLVEPLSHGARSLLDILGDLGSKIFETFNKYLGDGSVFKTITDGVSSVVHALATLLFGEVSHELPSWLKDSKTLFDVFNDVLNSDFAKSVDQKAKEIGKFLIETLPNAFKLATDVIKWFVGQVNDKIKKIRDFATRIFELVKSSEKFKNLKANVLKYVNPVVDTLTKFGKKVKDILKSKDPFKALSDSVSGLVAKIKSTGIYKTLSTLKNTIVGVIKSTNPLGTAWKKVKEFFGSFGEKFKVLKDSIAEIFKSGSIIEGFKTWINGVWSTVKTKVSEFFANIGAFIKEKFDKFISRFRPNKENGETFASKIFSVITNDLAKARDKLKSFIGKYLPNIKTLLGKVGDFLLGLFVSKAKADEFGGAEGGNEPSIFMKIVDKLKSGFDKLKNFLSKTLAAHLPQIKAIWEKVKNFLLGLFISTAKADDEFGAPVETEEKSFFGKVVDKLSSWYSYLKEKLTPVLNSIKDFFSNTFGGGASDGTSPIINGFNTVKDFFTNVKTKVVEIANSIGITDLQSLIDKIGGFAGALTGLYVFGNIGRTFGSIASIGKSSSKVIKSFTKVTKSWATLTKSLKNPLGSLIQSVTGLVTGTTESSKGLWASLSEAVKGNGESAQGVFGAFKDYITAMIDPSKSVVEQIPDLVKGFTKSKTKKVDSWGTSLLKIAGSLLIAVGAFYLLGKMDKNMLETGKQGIVMIGSAFAIFAIVMAGIVKNVGGEDFGQAGSSILKMALAIGILAVVAYAMGKLASSDPVMLGKGIGVIAVLGLIIAGLQWIMGQAAKVSGGNKSVGGVLSSALAILLLTIPLKRLGSMDPQILLRGLAAITWLGLVIGAMQLLMGKAASLKDGNKSIGGVLSSAIAIWILSIPVRKLGEMNLDQLIQGGVAVLVLAGIIVGMQLLSAKAAKIKGQNSAITGAVATAAAVLILALAAVALGIIPKTILDKGVVTILELAGIIVGIQLLSAFASRIKGRHGKKVEGVAAIVLAIVVLAVATVALGLIPRTILEKGLTVVVAIAGILVVMQLVMALTSKFVNVGGIFTAIIAAGLMVVLVYVLGSVFAAMKDVPVETMTTFADSFLKIFLALAGVISVMSLIPWSAGIKTAAIIGTFFIVLSAALAVAAGIASVGMSSVNTMIFTLGSTLGTFSDLTAGGSAEDAKKMVEDISSMVDDIIHVAVYAADVETFKTAVTRIGNGLKAFGYALRRIDTSKASDALSMTKTINEIVGLLKQSGVDSFPDMSVGIGYLGSAISLYADSVNGVEIPTDATFDAEGMKTALQSIATSLPGDELLATFKELASTEEGSKGTELMKFALGMEAIKNALFAYGEVCVDLPIEAVKAANEALGQIAGLTANIPGKESFSFSFLGFNGTFESNQSDLEKFASNVGDLSTGLDEFVDATKDIDPKKVESAIDALDSVSQLKPPGKPGLLDFLTGRGTLESFATQMGYLADGFAKYAEAAGKEGLNYDNITESKTVISELASIQNELDPDGGVIGLIGGTAKEAFSGLASNMEGLGKGVAAFATNIHEGNPSYTNTHDAIQVIRDLAELYRDMPNVGGIFAIFSGDIDLNDFSNKIPILATGIANFAKNLEGVNLSGDTVSKAVDYIESFARIQAKIKTPGDMQLDTFAGQIQSASTRLKEISTNLTVNDFKFNEENINKFVGFLTSFKDIAIQMRDFKTNENVDFKKFGEQIKGFFESLMQLSTDSSPFSKWFNDEKLKNLTDGIKAPFEAIKDAFVSVKNLDTGELSISGTITQILKDGIAALTDQGMKGEYKDGGVALVTELQNGVKSKDIKTETYNVGVEGSNELKTEAVYTTYVEAGKYLVAGLAEGLGKMDSALEAAKELARKVLEEMQHEMDEHSPSKKTMMFGQYLDEGLAIGIEKYGSMANTAAGNIAKLVLGTMDSAFSDYSDYRFTITPVLDTTNIASYADAVSGVKSEWNTLGSIRMPAVSRVAESMDVNVNDRYANTMESFRSEIADLGDRITSMRVVMDTGTVVGELAPGMDAALGRRANYSSRRIS